MWPRSRNCSSGMNFNCLRDINGVYLEKAITCQTCRLLNSDQIKNKMPIITRGNTIHNSTKLCCQGHVRTYSKQMKCM